MILVIGPYMTPHETYERQQLEAGNYWKQEVEHQHQRRNPDKAEIASTRGIPQSGVYTGQDSPTQ
jgi:hypothetical protein